MKFLYALGVAMAFVLAAPTLSAFQAPSVKGFVPNEGQWPSEVLYLNKADNLNIWVTRTGLVMDQYRIDDATRTGHVLKLSWNNAAPQQTSSATDKQYMSTTVNMFSGKGQWHSGMPVLSSMRFANVWPGIDLVYYLDEAGRMRYDFDVRPGAPIQEVGFSVEGDIGMQIDPQDVSLKTSVGSISMGDLYAYVLGRRTLNTQAVFTARSTGVQFSVPQWKGDVPLRVDPVVYGTYVGGDEDDAVIALRVVNDGVYVGGWSASIEFPAQAGAYRKDALGARDAYVAKMSKDFSTVIAYTYYGGAKDDRLTAMDVDLNGSVFITGETASTDLPTTVGAVGQVFKNDIDGFVAVFDGDLATLKVSTYFGGNKVDMPMAIVAANDGSVFVCGGTTSDQNFPTTLAHQATFGGQQDAFMLRLSPTGGSFVFCTYFGKAGVESFRAIALDNSGYPFVTGSTTSSDFETAPTPGRWSSGRVPYDRSYNDGNSDAFLIKFFADGTLSKRDDGTFSTFFGGKGEEEGRGVFVDDLGRPTIVGVTNSPNLPTTGAQQTTPLGKQDIFMAIFTDDGRGLNSCTYFGGTGDDDVLGMVADNFRNSAIVFGTTNSLDFPVTGTGIDDVRKGATDAFIAAFNPASSRYVTLVGGVGEDAITSMSTDANGDYYFVMDGNSPDLFTQRTSWQTTRPGGKSSYVGKWADGDLGISAPAGGERWCKGTTRTVSWSKVAMRDDDRFTVEYTIDDGDTWTKLADKLASNSYQWQIPTSLSIDDQYRIRVFSSRGHESWSQAFTLANPPGIVAEPAATSACAGAAVTLVVEATGSDIRYQWRYKGANIKDATSATYVIESLSADNAGQYDVVVNGVCLPNVTSKSVAVTMATATAVTTQPKGVSVEENQAITLTVVATGGNLTYQWKRNGTPIDNATSSTLTIAKAAMADAGEYTCDVMGTCGSTTTEAATVVVSPSTSVSEGESVAYGLKVLGPIPTSSVVRVQITSPSSGMASFRLVDGQGAVVGTIDAGMVNAGTSVLEVPVNALASGSYGIELSLNGQSLRGMVLVVR